MNKRRICRIYKKHSLCIYINRSEHTFQFVDFWSDTWAFIPPNTLNIRELNKTQIGCYKWFCVSCNFVIDRRIKLSVFQKWLFEKSSSFWTSSLITGSSDEKGCSERGRILPHNFTRLSHASIDFLVINFNVALSTASEGNNSETWVAYPEKRKTLIKWRDEIRGPPETPPT